MATKKYYSLENILKHNAQYNILLGMRSNGKSYAVKYHVLQKAYNHKGNFIYMRRYKDYIKGKDVESYFRDMPISKITRNEYEGISVYRGTIYFCNFDDNDKVIRGLEIGRAVDLNGMESYKSQVFSDITDIIFEEFVTNGLYLDNEPNILQNFVSTIARDRTIQVWMIGNNISRVCPYFQEYCLRNIPKQAQGTIDIYNFDRTNVDGEVYTTKIAVENCANVGTSSKMFFGTVADSITGGQWEVKDYPHMPIDEKGREKPYVKLYELLYSDMGFSFILALCIDEETGGQWVYVKPHTTARFIRRKVTNEFSTDPFITNSLSDDIPAEVIIRKLINNNKICYSDNLTGSDFEAVTLNRKGRL